MKRAAEEICLAGWYGSAISRERLRQHLILQIPRNDPAVLHSALGNLQQHLRMLDWRPDPSRMDLPNRTRFLQLVADDGSCWAAPRPRSPPAPSPLIWFHNFSLQHMDVDPPHPKMPSIPSSDDHEVYSANESDAPMPPDYPSPTDEDLRLLDELNDQEQAFGAGPPPPFDSDFMSDDEFEYLIGEEPKPSEAGQNVSDTQSDFEGPTYLQTLYDMEMHDDERSPEDEADVLLEEPAGELAVVASDTDLTDPLFLEMTQTNMTYDGGHLSAVFPDYIPSENYVDGAALDDHSHHDLDTNAVPVREAVINHHGANRPLSNDHREIYAMRTLDSLYPVVSADKKERTRTTLHSAARHSLTPRSSRVFYFFLLKVSLIPPRLARAPSQTTRPSTPLRKCRSVVTTTLPFSAPFPDFDPVDNVVGEENGIMMNCDGVAISDLASVGDALPDLAPSHSEQLDNAADSLVGLLADASGSLDFYSVSLRGSGAPHRGAPLPPWQGLRAAATAESQASAGPAGEGTLVGGAAAAGVARRRDGHDAGWLAEALGRHAPEGGDRCSGGGSLQHLGTGWGRHRPGGLPALRYGARAALRRLRDGLQDQVRAHGSQQGCPGSAQ
ncbi:unnamed protein product [Prorocentrum cordatum]|uniref:Uncharacterized protein n=1 Tax=Prorocentrum cordatum TaxID=2364126 RepID=A0ABN9UAT0_9DINO|nr:unnamed protein product [Polarella glacialis]